MRALFNTGDWLRSIWIHADKQIKGQWNIEWWQYITVRRNEPSTSGTSQLSWMSENTWCSDTVLLILSDHSDILLLLIWPCQLWYLLRVGAYVILMDLKHLNRHYTWPPEYLIQLNGHYTWLSVSLIILICCISGQLVGWGTGWLKVRVVDFQNSTWAVFLIADLLKSGESEESDNQKNQEIRRIRQLEESDNLQIRQTDKSGNPQIRKSEQSEKSENQPIRSIRQSANQTNQQIKRIRKSDESAHSKLGYLSFSSLYLWTTRTMAPQ